MIRQLKEQAILEISGFGGAVAIIEGNTADYGLYYESTHGPHKRLNKIVLLDR
jgi:hypothetical protein